MISTKTFRRDQALKILDELIENDNLRKHMLAVEACVSAYASKYGEDEEMWGIAGLLHDADWEKYPKEHPKIIVEKLRGLGVTKEIVQAIASHGNNSEQYPTNRFTERKTLLDRVLFASDELSGFIIACALVRPDKLNGMKVKSVKKKLKDKSFAATVSREDIKQGALDLEIELDDHISFCIDVLTKHKDIFGF